MGIMGMTPKQKEMYEEMAGEIGTVWNKHYWCDRCDRLHRWNSNIGRKHLEDEE